MNKDIMRKCGFNKEVDLVEKGICPFCKRQVDLNIISKKWFPKSLADRKLSKAFRDEISLLEFKISGLCQECRDKTFKEK